LTTLSVRLLYEFEELEQLSEPWRELAHTCACPAALPGWQLAWWRNLAPESAQLRAVAVFEQRQLVGLATFFVNPGRRVDYRLVGAGVTHRLSPLALPGREREIARLVAHTLADSSPTPDLIAFEGIDAASPWPDAVARNWPGLRPWRYTSSTHPGPVIELRGQTFESWFAGRRASFRKQMRQARRRAEQAGGRVVLAGHDEEIERAIDGFLRLHKARWARRGGSRLAEESFSTTADAARLLAPRGEMGLWMLDLAGRIVAVQVTLAAGGETLCFSSGFDEAHAGLSPALLTILAAVEDAFERGGDRFDLGAGSEPYKLSFATADAPITWTGLVPRGRRYPLTRARLAPDRARWRLTRLARRLSPERKKQLKRLLGRD
jgi:CelD/BcsL family acetyltransferase involved in cellulose biosynthesis